MPRDSSILADIFGNKLKSLEKTRSKIVALQSRGLISRYAVSHFYEGLFLNSHVLFEVFVEDLFIGLLLNEHGFKSRREDVVPRVEVNSFKIARELVIGPSRTYVDWLPYDRTLKLAKIFFRGGRPFSDLTKPMAEHLQKCHLIRNVIAHKSRSSYRQFNDEVIGSLPLPPRERTPAGYLSSNFRISPAQTRYENFVISLLSIARYLSR